MQDFLVFLDHSGTLAVDTRCCLVFYPFFRLFVFALEKTAETSFVFLIDTLISLC